MGFVRGSVAIAVRVGNGFFRGNVCPVTASDAQCAAGASTCGRARSLQRTPTSDAQFSMEGQVGQGRRATVRLAFHRCGSGLSWL